MATTMFLPDSFLTSPIQDRLDGSRTSPMITELVISVDNMFRHPAAQRAQTAGARTFEPCDSCRCAVLMVKVAPRFGPVVKTWEDDTVTSIVCHDY